MLIVVVESMAGHEDFTWRNLFQGANVRKFRTLLVRGPSHDRHCPDPSYLLASRADPSKRAIKIAAHADINR